MARRPYKARKIIGSRTSVGVLSINASGRAFANTSEGSFHIKRSRLNGAMDGDLVEIVPLHANSGQDSLDSLGSVTRVLQRSHETLIGVLEYVDGLGVVVTDDAKTPYDVFLDPLCFGRPAKDGDVVVVQITCYPSRYQSCSGYIVDVLGNLNDKGIDTEIIIRRYGLETNFLPNTLLSMKEALREVSLGEDLTFCDALSAFKVSQPKRRDLREWRIFTIDPHDARDFDDALSIQILGDSMRLGVHIADVSAYVPLNSDLDLAARRRGTSVYLPDRVIPMLPAELSEDVCSLRPNEDRLTMTVDMLISANGSVTKVEFYHSIIRSQARLTYDEVQKLLVDFDTFSATDASFVYDSDTKCEAKFGLTANLVRDLLTLDKLARKLAQKRDARGALDFDIAEPRVYLNNEGIAQQVVLRSKNRATALVEEMMILANEAVAMWMLEQDAPMVYRVHDEPNPAVLEELLPVLRAFGLNISEVPSSSQGLKQLMSQAQETLSTGSCELINILLLRAMKKARYLPVFTTHFGLASLAYTHFTSPIRRYPDLMVHRLLKLRLANFAPTDELLKQLELICGQCSDAEVKAENATRDALQLKICEYFSSHIGSCYMAIISSVTATGFFVREQKGAAMGFVKAQALGANFSFVPEQYCWQDMLTGEKFSLGELIRVRLTDVDMQRLRMDFVVA
ncbi:MAG: VacB/RNase II family 3'-5' exoribonuclease [Coriobacteriales bacterium]|jgi:ribonuclease R|nr:VacB/RNase II family 3'-5' exoribonuclease [Coriobacteriales bacterium]